MPCFVTYPPYPLPVICNFPFDWLSPIPLPKYGFWGLTLYTKFLASIVVSFAAEEYVDAAATDSILVWFAVSFVSVLKIMFVVLRSLYESYWFIIFI